MSVLLLAPVVALAVLGAVAAVLRVQRMGQRDLVGRVVESPSGTRRKPSILYFTGATCTICHTAQTPALSALRSSVRGEVDIREIDIAASPDIARTYRVMSLPTTIVLDERGEIADINVGFASVDKLLEQLEAIGVAVAA